MKTALVLLALASVVGCPGSDPEPGPTPDIVADLSQDSAADGGVDADVVTASDAADVATSDAVDSGSPDATDVGDTAVADVPPFNELQPGVYRLNSILMGDPVEDLQVLGDAVGTARVVGLGEAYHLSGGYHWAKARVVEYLVEARGFRAITIESPWGVAQAVNAYIHSDCSGSAADAVTGGLATLWHSQSMADLVSWMCMYNQQNSSDPVYFFGLDISQPEYDVPALNTFAIAIEAPDAATWASGLAQCQQPYSINPAPTIDAAATTACLGAIDAIESYFDANAASITTSIAPEDLERARASAISLRASQQRMALDYAPPQYPIAWAARDAGMYGLINTLWPVYAADAKLIVLAANAHVAKAWQAVTLPTMGGIAFGTQSVGSLLAADLGSDYVSVAVTSYQTQTVNGPQPIMTDPEAIEVILHDLAEPFLLVDFSVATALFEPAKPYLLGAAQLTYSSVPADQFNLLLFMESSDALTFLQ